MRERGGERGAGWVLQRPDETWPLEPHAHKVRALIIAPPPLHDDDYDDDDGGGPLSGLVGKAGWVPW